MHGRAQPDRLGDYVLGAPEAATYRSATAGEQSARLRDPSKGVGHEEGMDLGSGDRHHTLRLLGTFKGAVFGHRGISCPLGRVS